MVLNMRHKLLSITNKAKRLISVIKLKVIQDICECKGRFIPDSIMPNYVSLFWSDIGLIFGNTAT